MTLGEILSSTAVSKNIELPVIEKESVHVTTTSSHALQETQTSSPSLKRKSSTKSNASTENVSAVNREKVSRCDEEQSHKKNTDEISIPSNSSSNQTFEGRRNLPIPTLSEIPPGPMDEEDNFDGSGPPNPPLSTSTEFATPNPLMHFDAFPMTPAKEASTDPSTTASIIVATGPVGEGSIRKRRAGRRWTAHEDAVLKALVEKNGHRHWKKCAREFQELSGSVRSDVQCLHRWNKCLRPGLVKGQWTPEEDAIIIQMIKENGGHHNVRWSVIAKKLNGRLGKQVRERWINHLDPSIVKKEWSSEEDEQLYQLQKRFGNRWKWIAELMPGRSENGVKNRWHSIKPSMLARKDQKEGGAAPAVLSVPKNPKEDPKAVQATARTMTAAAVKAAANAIASKNNKAASKRPGPRKLKATPGRKRTKTEEASSPRPGTLADLLSIGQQFAAAADKNIANAEQAGFNMNLEEVAEKAKELLRMSESYREMARAMIAKSASNSGKTSSTPTSPHFNAHIQQEISHQIGKQLAQAQHSQQDSISQAEKAPDSRKASLFGSSLPSVQTSLDAMIASSHGAQQATPSPMTQDPVLFKTYLTMFANSISQSSPSTVTSKHSPTSTTSESASQSPSITTTPTMAGLLEKGLTKSEGQLSPHQLLAAAAAVAVQQGQQQSSAA